MRGKGIGSVLQGQVVVDGVSLPISWPKSLPRLYEQKSAENERMASYLERCSPLVSKHDNAAVGRFLEGLADAWP